MTSGGKILVMPVDRNIGVVGGEFYEKVGVYSAARKGRVSCRITVVPSRERLGRKIYREDLRKPGTQEEKEATIL